MQAKCVCYAQNEEETHVLVFAFGTRAFFRYQHAGIGSTQSKFRVRDTNMLVFKNAKICVTPDANA